MCIRRKCILKVSAEKAAEKAELKFTAAVASADEIHREVNSLIAEKSGLQSKIASLVRTKEEAEEIAASHLNKFRKAQNEIREAEARLDAAEQQANKLRAEKRNAL